MWRGYKSGGIAALSRIEAAKVLKKMRIHDDGIIAFGGISSLISGPMGCGKTTFLIQLAAGVGHVSNGMRKEDHTNQNALYPETIIWRGRKFDYWNSLVDWNFSRSYPNANIHRKTVVHINAGDELRFIEQTHTKPEFEFDDDMAKIKYYKNSNDLFKNLEPRGVNVVYEPNNYYLDPDVVEALTKRTLEDLRKARKRKLNQDGKSTKLPSNGIAPSPICWVECIEKIIHLKRQEEFFSIFIDEAHGVIPEKIPGEHWHLIGWLVQTLVDLRRNNVSLFLATHDAQDIDYRVRSKILYWAWMPGAKVYPKYSIFVPSITGKLQRGEFLVESISPRNYGMSSYLPIPYQPPTIHTEGLKAST